MTKYFCQGKKPKPTLDKTNQLTYTTLTKGKPTMQNDNDPRDEAMNDLLDQAMLAN